MNIKKKATNINTTVSLASQARLVEIMNNSPRITSFAKTEWEITALKPQVQYWIAEEAIKIEKIEQATTGDVLIGMVKNFDSVVRVITLALLNDKKRIKEEYDIIFDVIKYESKMHDWATLLSEILQMLNLSFFFLATDVIQTFRVMTTERKITSQEARSLSQGQNTDK